MNYEKMTHDDVITKCWVDGTYLLIVALLSRAGVPFERGEVWDDSIHDYRRQLIFPWAKTNEGHIPDVLVGLVHADDLCVFVFKTASWDVRPYPSIETYKFPWDNDDITVFSCPEEFVKTVENYYHQCEHSKEEE